MKTPALASNYYNEPESDTVVFGGEWFHTKDYGELDERGMLFVYGRMAQHKDAPDGQKVYLFDISNRLRDDPAVKEALVCQLVTANNQLVAHIVLEDTIHETETDVLCRLDRMMATFLPAGLRIEAYRLEREHLRINIVGKIDRHYYSHILTDYCEIRDGKLTTITFPSGVLSC